MKHEFFALKDVARSASKASNMAARYPGPWMLTFENAPESIGWAGSARVRLWFAGNPVPEMCTLNASLAPGHNCSRPLSGTCAPEALQFVWSGPDGEMSSARMALRYEDNRTLELVEVGFETTMHEGVATGSAWQVFAAAEADLAHTEGDAPGGSAPSAAHRDSWSAANRARIHLIRIAS